MYTAGAFIPCKTATYVSVPVKAGMHVDISTDGELEIAVVGADHSALVMSLDKLTAKILLNELKRYVKAD